MVLRVNTAQMRDLTQRRRELFVERLVGLLRRVFPDSLNAASQESLREFADATSARATNYGFRTESDVAEFVLARLELALRRGSRHEPEWFVAIATDQTMPPSARLHRLLSRWRDELSERPSIDALID